MADATAIYKRVMLKADRDGTFRLESLEPKTDAICRSLILGACIIAEAIRNEMDEPLP